MTSERAGEGADMDALVLLEQQHRELGEMLAAIVDLPRGGARAEGVARAVGVPEKGLRHD